MNLPKAIAELDLSAVHTDLVRDGMTVAEADQAIVLYRQFLALCFAYPTARICPPSAADKVWHPHILRTRHYRDACEAIFGRPLDHNPDVFGTPEFAAAWAETRQLFRQHFGVELNPNPSDLDSSVTSAGACYREGDPPPWEQIERKAA